MMAPAQVSALDPILGTEDALPATHDDEVVVDDVTLLQRMYAMTALARMK